MTGKEAAPLDRETEIILQTVGICQTCHKDFDKIAGQLTGCSDYRCPFTERGARYRPYSDKDMEILIYAGELRSKEEKIRSELLARRAESDMALARRQRERIGAGLIWLGGFVAGSLFVWFTHR